MPTPYVNALPEPIEGEELDADWGVAVNDDIGYLYGQLVAFTVFDDVASAKIATGFTTARLYVIKGFGTYRWVATTTDVADEENVIAVTSVSSGQLIREAAHPDAIFAYIAPFYTDLINRMKPAIVSVGLGAALAVTTTNTRVTAFNNVISGNLPDYDPTTGRLTASREGWYEISISAISNGVVFCYPAAIDIWLNGSYLTPLSAFHTPTNSTEARWFGSCKLYLVPGDVVELYAFTVNNSATFAVTAGNRLTIQRLGD